MSPLSPFLSSSPSLTSLPPSSQAWLDSRSRKANELCDSAHIESCSVALSDEEKTKIPESEPCGGVMHNSDRDCIHLVSELNSLSNVVTLTDSAAEKRPLTADVKKESAVGEDEKSVISYLPGLSWVRPRILLIL